jgi:hypothetical protein
MEMSHIYSHIEGGFGTMSLFDWLGVSFDTMTPVNQIIHSKSLKPQLI